MHVMLSWQGANDELPAQPVLKRARAASAALSWVSWPLHSAHQLWRAHEFLGSDGHHHRQDGVQTGLSETQTQCVVLQGRHRDREMVGRNREEATSDSDHNLQRESMVG